MDTAINFPNIGIFFDNVGKTINVFGMEIAFYGIIIGLGMILGSTLVCREAKRTGQNVDNYFDLLMWGIVMGVVGARLYYVVFSWDAYKDNLLQILNIRNGGLAIYGGVIGGFLALFFYTKIKKLKFWLVVDTCTMGLLLGQIMGRWGNFFNREAFGGYTNNLLAMQLPVSAVRSNEITQTMWDHVQTVGGVEFIQVHPTFLYESLWNLGILLLIFLYRKRKKFDGELFMLYLCGYGAGRFWIESLRTDQLLIPGIGFPVSQALAACFIIIGVGVILYKRIKLKKNRID